MNRTNDTKYIFHDLVAVVAGRSHRLRLETGKAGSFVQDQLLVHTTVELYDLQSDPPETVNLTGKPQSNDLKRDPVIQLVTWIQETNDPLHKWAVSEPYYNNSTEVLDALYPVSAY